MKTKRPVRDTQPDALVLQPEDYEDVRQALNLQPARVKDSRGAHYEKA